MDFYSKKSGDYSDIEFEKDLVNGETGIILEKLEKMANDGADFVIFREGLLNFFQKKLLSFFNIGDGSKSVMDLKSLELWINLLIRAAKQEKETEIDQLPLELAVIDFLDKGRDGERNKISDNTKISKEETVKKKQKIAEPLEDPDKGIDFDNKDLVTVDVGGLDLDKIVESWGNILMAVKPFNHSVEAFLRASRPARVEGKTLVLEVFYPFHKDRLEEVKNRKIVEGGLCKVLGSELGFECVLSKGKKPPLIIENNTPVESVNENLTKGSKDENKADLYDIAKDIFG